MIRGKQFTILWHVDNLQISLVKKALVEEILKKLMTQFGQDSPLTTSRGEVLDYLGIQIDYLVKGKVSFSMKEYIKKLLDEVPFDMGGVANTPAANHLFSTNENEKNLTE